MSWAAYFGLAAVIVSALALVIGLSRLDWRGIALAVVALIGRGLIACVPWHYDQIRQTMPIHDITTNMDTPPAFVAVVPLRQGEGINPVAYKGGKIAEQQQRAYPDVVPLTVGLAPNGAFGRALDTAQHMIGRLSQQTRREAELRPAREAAGWASPTISSGSRIDLRSSSRYGRSDFGVNVDRIRAYLMALRAAAAARPSAAVFP